MSGEFVGSWRVALRIAGRSARRNRGRSLLILLMLFLPAYAATVLAICWANLGALDRETNFRIGSADLVLSASQPDLDRLATSLPAGGRTAPHGSGRTVVAAPDGALSNHEYEATDPTDPLNRGRYVIRAGVVPRTATEVALTRSLAGRLGVTVGDRIEAGLPLRQLTVVGIIDLSRSLRLPALVVPADAPLSSGVARSLLVDLPPGADWSGPPQGANHRVLPDGTTVPDGIQYGMIDRAALAPTPAHLAIQATAATLVITFAATQVGLLVGAAFLVGARRQRRELALLAAAGASGRQVGRVVLAGGLLLGTVAAGTGTLLGLATPLVAAPVIERISDHPLRNIVVPVWSVVAVAAVTILVGTLAAYLPARSVSRTPVRAELGGQRNRSRADLAWLAFGLVLLGAGTVILLLSAHPDGRSELIAVGGMLLPLAVAAGAPALVRGVGRIAGLLPVSGRLALRHAARHRLRTGAAVAAVSAAVAGSVALGLVGAARGEAAEIWRDARDGQVLLPAEAGTVLGPDGTARLAAVLPARSAVALRTATHPDLPPGSVFSPLPGLPPVGVAGEQIRIAVGGAETIRAVTGREPTPAELDTVDGGGAVVFNDTLVVEGRVAIAPGEPGPVTVPAVVAVRGEYFRKLPGVLISAATARRAGLTVTPGEVLVDTTRMPRPDELAAATTVLLRAQLAAEPVPATPMLVEPARVRTGPTENRTMFWLLAAVSAMVTVLASGVAVGLSMSELGDDLATMSAVGAGPRVRRGITAAQAAVVVGLGTPLGLLAGLGPAAGYVAFHSGAHWRTPWLALLLILVVPPLAATVLAGSLTRSRTASPRWVR